MTAMTERPILFSGPMVRAILEGRKTQTRRVVKPQPVGNEACEPGDTTFIGGVLHKARESRGRNKAASGELVAYSYSCPYGQPGDRLWVRETFCGPYLTTGGNDLVEAVSYKATDKTPTDHRGCDMKWRPSIHMPCWASRLTLEVTAVRVERLRNISNADARAEGVVGVEWGNGLDYGGDANYKGPFEELWDSINAKRGHGWDTNPWVWVVEFKKVDA